jgi:putative selenate reductase
MPEADVPVLVCRLENGKWQCREGSSFGLTKKHQIAIFADFCNECGNCDVFCPEDGGPYLVKPQFFGSAAEFERFADRDGFFVGVDGESVQVRARFDTRQYMLAVNGRSADYASEGFEVAFSFDDPAGTITGRADRGVEVDLTYALIMDLIQRWVLDEASVNYVNAAQ